MRKDSEDSQRKAEDLEKGFSFSHNFFLSFAVFFAPVTPAGSPSGSKLRLDVYLIFIYKDFTMPFSFAMHLFVFRWKVAL